MKFNFPWRYEVDHLRGFRIVESGGRTLVSGPATLDEIRLMSVAPDFYKVCRGEEDEQPTPLEWMRAILIDYRECLQKHPELNEEPEATAEALIKADTLLDSLTAAVAKAEGRTS